MGVGVHDCPSDLLCIPYRRDQSRLGSTETAPIPNAPLEATPLASFYSPAVLRCPIVVGVLGANPVTNPTIPHSADKTAKVYLDAVTYGSLASCEFWIWRMKGFRWYATSLMALVELITWGALFVAGMSITGDWL
jgi:hypothetical protein